MVVKSSYRTLITTVLREHRVFRQPARDVAGHLVDFAADLVEIGQVLFVGALRAARLPFVIRLDGAIVAAHRQVVQPLRRAADDGSQRVDRLRADVDQPLDAVGAKPLCGRGPTPHSASTGRPWRNDSMRSGAMTVSPFGFFQPDAILARNLLGATPADAVRPVVSRIDLLDPLGDGDAERLLPRVLRHVEIRLVERQRLDERRHARGRSQTPARDTPRYF